MIKAGLKVERDLGKFVLGEDQNYHTNARGLGSHWPLPIRSNLYNMIVAKGYDYIVLVLRLKLYLIFTTHESHIDHFIILHYCWSIYIYYIFIAVNNNRMSTLSVRLLGLAYHIICCCSLTDRWKRIRTAHRRLRPSPRTRCSCTTHWTSRWFFCTIHIKWCELNRNMFMKLTMFNVYAHVGTYRYNIVL